MVTSQKSHGKKSLAGSLAFIRSQLENKEKAGSRGEESSRENPYHEVKLQHNKIRPSVSSYECSSARQYPHENFRVRTSVSATSKIRVTLSSDGSMLEIETEKLQAAQTQNDGAQYMCVGGDRAITDDEDFDGYVCLMEEPGVSGVSNLSRATWELGEHCNQSHDGSSLSSSDGDIHYTGDQRHSHTLTSLGTQCAGKGKQHRKQGNRSAIKSGRIGPGEVINHGVDSEASATDYHCTHNTCARCEGQIVQGNVVCGCSRCLGDTERQGRAEGINLSANRHNTVISSRYNATAHEVSHKVAKGNNDQTGSLSRCLCQTNLVGNDSYCVVGSGAATDAISPATCCQYHHEQASDGNTYTPRYPGRPWSPREHTPLSTPITEHTNYENPLLQTGKHYTCAMVHNEEARRQTSSITDPAVTNGCTLEDNGGVSSLTTESITHHVPACDYKETNTDSYRTVKPKLKGTHSSYLINDRGESGSFNNTPPSSTITESTQEGRGSAVSLTSWEKNHSLHKSLGGIRGPTGKDVRDGRIYNSSGKLIGEPILDNGVSDISKSQLTKHHVSSNPDSKSKHNSQTSPNITSSVKKKRNKFWLRKVHSENDKEQGNSNCSNSGGNMSMRQRNKLKTTTSKCLSFDSASILENKPTRDCVESPDRRKPKPTKNAFIHCANGTGPKTESTTSYSVSRSYSIENSNSPEAGSSSSSNKNFTTPVYRCPINRSDSSDHSLASAHSSDLSNSSRRSSHKNKLIGENTTHQVIQVGLMVSNPLEHEVCNKETGGCPKTSVNNMAIFNLP